MFKHKNTIIFGGTGFVGEYLVKFLKREGIRTSVIYNGRLSETEKKPGVKYYKTDLKKNFKRNLPTSLNAAVIMTQPDDLIIKNIIKTLGQAKNLKKIIFISTILVYPNSPKKTKESTTPQPKSPYEKGKIEEEGRLTDYAKKRNIKLSIIRMANVYGDKKNKGIIGLVFNSILNKTPLVINGDGNQKRDYIFIEDAASFIKSVVLYKQIKPIEIFNICTGKGQSINESIKLIKKLTGINVLVSHAQAVPEKRSVIGNNAKITKLFGKPVYSFLKGLSKTYLNYLSK